MPASTEILTSSDAGPRPSGATTQGSSTRSSPTTFTVGPVGFVLSREQWLARFGNGLENRHIGLLQTARAPS